MLTFMGTAEAFVTPQFSPDIPKTYNQCIKTGASPAACQALLEAPHKCETKHSQDEDDWIECLAEAEANYYKSIGVAATSEPYLGESLPVSTNTADATYEYPADDERKGFLQAKEK